MTEEKRNNKSFIAIFKEGSKVLYQYEEGHARNKSYLIVDVLGSRELFEKMSKDDLNNLIKTYISRIRRREIKRISFNDLYSQSSKSSMLVTLFNSTLRMLLANKTIKRVENSRIINIIFTVIFFGILYFFYQLGYAFLYGFYFGGDIGEEIPIMSMFVNPVPFNFKSLVVIGILFLINVSVILFPVGRFLLARDKKSKWWNIVVFIVSVLVIFINCLYAFVGSGEQGNYKKLSDLAFILLFLPSALAFMIVWYSRAIKYGLVFFSTTLYAILILFLLVFKILKLDNSYFELVGLFGLFVFPVFIITGIDLFIKSLSKFIKNLNQRLLYKLTKDIIIFAPYILLSVTLLSKTMQMLTVDNNIVHIFISVTLIILFFVAIVLKNTGVLHSLFGKNKDKNERIRSEEEIKRDKEVGSTILIVSSLLFLGMVCIFLPSICATSGRLVRQSIIGLPKEKVILNSNEDKYFFGNLVAKTDSTLYISKCPERKLVTVKNEYVTIIPCESFVIDNSPVKYPNRFLNILDAVKVKHSFLEGENISLVPHEPIVKENEFKYIFEFSLQEASQQLTKEELMFNYQLEVNMSTDVYNNINSFYIEIKRTINESDSPFGSCQYTDKIEELTVDFLKTLNEYLKLPKLDKQNTTYYYSDGKLDYRKTQKSSNDKKTVTNIEGYFFD